MSSPTDAPISLGNPPNAPRKAPAPQWRTWALVGIPPCPNFATEEEEEKVALKEEEDYAAADWEREVLEGLAIRPKFLTWTPREVEKIDNLESLKLILQFLRRKFGCPNSQPRNEDEQFFLLTMYNAVVDRISDLNFPSCE